MMSASQRPSCLNWIVRVGCLTIGLAGLMTIMSQKTKTTNLTSVVFVGDGRPSCDSVFNQDAYSKGNPLHPRRCLLKNYRSEDLVQCLDQLASEVTLSKKRNYFHIAFSGDSRIRQMYHSFSEMLPLYDANITGHIHTREIVLHQDAQITSQVLRLKVSFQWNPFVNQELQDSISHWIKAGVQEAPDILILGNLIWIINEDHHVESYSNRLRNLRHLLSNLTRTTKVIWWDQDQINEPNYHHVAEQIAHADVNNKRIREFNQSARQAFEDTGVLIWNSTHTLLGEYIRACAGFPARRDPWRRWNCPDAVHASFLYAHMYNQRLLNYLCNPFMELDDRFCCYSNQDTIFNTRKS